MSGRTRRNPDANFRALKLMLEAEAQRMAERPRASYVYSSAQELVLEHGRRWRWRRLSRDLSPATRWGIPRGCFSNSLLAAQFHPDLRYVEGYAYAGQFPIHHAWNVDPDGVVLDFTWQESEFNPARGRAYMGVVVPIEHAWEQLWDFERSVLDCPPDWPTFRAPWVVDDHPPRPSVERVVEMLGDVSSEFAEMAKARLAS